MSISLLLFSMALLLRGGGTLLRRPQAPLFLQVSGWLFSMLAIWLTVIALGAWALWWPVLLLTVVGTGLGYVWREQPYRWVLLAAADFLLILLAGQTSVPPLAWEILLPAALLLPIIAFCVDLAARWSAQRVARGWLVVAGLMPLLLLAIIPITRNVAGSMLEARFIYLLPQPTSAPPTPRPEPTATSAMFEAQPIPSPQPTVMPAVIVEETAVGTLNAQGMQWSPYLEWRLPNPTYTGNPFDLTATATFTHMETGKVRTTGMFYNGEDIWAFRFSGTEPGEWRFITQSADPDLDNHQGRVWIEPNPGATGFVTHYGNKWGRSGLDRAFVPQFVMIDSPQSYYNNPATIASIVDTFLVEHGFNGVQTAVFCRWFDLEQRQCSRINIADPNPDPRTFAALEALIKEVYAAGGVVHIWMWGDDSRSENPKRWGLNGQADQRLQRYIAARLGPLPGWTMGYGYDLWEWVSGDQLTEWHEYMHAHMGWAHYLGARASKNQLDQLSEALDYAAYEQHRPDYDLYVQTIEARPEKPAFSEDRFRIREPAQEKDYTMELTRRGLWHSAMAGGVANIWGNLVGGVEGNGPLEGSVSYPNPEMIKTYSLFFADRFWADLVRCNDLTNGVCLMRPTQAHYIFYREDAASILLDLSGMSEATKAVAIDTRLPYQEIELGALSAEVQTWNAPYLSDWAIAIGDFDPSEQE